MNRNKLLAFIYSIFLTLLVFQGVHGALLSLNYIPVMDDSVAMKSIQTIGSTVKFGWFFQLLHKQGVHLLVVVSVLLLALQIRKQELTLSLLIRWSSLVLLTFGLFLSIYTGNILVGDGYATQSFQIGGTIVKEIPLIGSLLHFLLFTPNQQELQTYALVRMYIVHVFFLPIILTALFCLQKPSIYISQLKSVEILFSSIGVMIFQIILALLLPTNPKVAPYYPDWFFTPIHLLQQELPAIIVGLGIGFLILFVLLVPIFIRKKEL
jgi:quinol-cytochrome oxidoreductase complex cytochrome b subunit